MPINTVIEVSKRIQSGRGPQDVMNSIMSEVGELAEEVSCAYGHTYKKAGRDGVLGEAVDVLASVIDLMYITNPDITHSDVIRVLKEKLQKWESKEREWAEKVRKDELELHVHDWNPYWNEDKLADYVECGICGEQERNFHPSCCNKEDRNMNGWCNACGDPCI